MFSFQTLHVLCELQNFLPKHCIMWPMPSYPFFGQCLRIFFWNLAILFSNSSLGSKNLKQNRYSLIKSKLTDLNNFIRKRVTAKSNDFTSLLFNGQHSKPYNKIGKHLHLTNSKYKRSPNWNSTSGFDLDQFSVIGVFFCIRLPNFVQIVAPIAKI